MFVSAIGMYSHNEDGWKLWGKSVFYYLGVLLPTSCVGGSVSQNTD